MFTYPLMTGVIPDAWGDITSAWEFDGDTADSTGYWKDETGTHHITAQASPGKIAGVQGDARGGIGGSVWTRTDRATDYETPMDYTIMCWCKTTTGITSGSGGYMFFLANSGFSATGQHAYFKRSGASTATTAGISLEVFTNGEVTASVNETVSAAKFDTWRHAVATYTVSDTKYRFYVNAEFIGEFTYPYFAAAFATAGFYFTDTWWSAGSGGHVDMARFFAGRALSLADIAAHYNGGAGLAYLA